MRGVPSAAVSVPPLLCPAPWPWWPGAAGLPHMQAPRGAPRRAVRGRAQASGVASGGGAQRGNRRAGPRRPHTAARAPGRRARVSTGHPGASASSPGPASPVLWRRPPRPCPPPAFLPRVRVDGQRSRRGGRVTSSVPPAARLASADPAGRLPRERPGWPAGPCGHPAPSPPETRLRFHRAGAVFRCREGSFLSPRPAGFSRLLFDDLWTPSEQLSSSVGPSAPLRGLSPEV